MPHTTSALPSSGSQPLEPSLTAPQLKSIEDRTKFWGKKLFAQLPDERPSILERRWWDDRVLDYSMRDEQVKVQLFRFIDVLPMLRSNQAVAEHLQQYLGSVADRLPPGMKTGLSFAGGVGLGRAALSRAAHLGATDFARRFIAGSNLKEVMATVRRARDRGRAFTLDILGEAVTSELEAGRYFDEYMNLIRSVSPQVNAWKEVPAIDRDNRGVLPRMNLSIKLSALDCRFDAIDPEGTTKRVGARLRELLQAAATERAFINVDMESYGSKDLTLAIFQHVLNEPEFRHTADVGIVIQCYLRDAEKDLVMLRDWARRRGTPVWVRLVKGAYWDYETIHAKAEGWPIPVYQNKWESDACFERAVRFVFQNRDVLRPALGTHNIRSMAHGIAVAEELDIPRDDFEYQLLYGMADAEKQTLSDLGYRVRIYMPYGELIPGMAYLVRRLLENTSNDSFLRASLEDRVDTDDLLRDPTEIGRSQVVAAGEPLAPDEAEAPGDTGSESPPNRDATQAPLKGPLRATFKNHPHTDFAVAGNRTAMSVAIEQVRGELGGYYPAVINGQRIGDDQAIHSDSRDETTIVSFDPSHCQRVVGVCHASTVAEADRAVEAAAAALSGWSATPVGERTKMIRAAAGEMRLRQFELAAWQVFECAKPWREATADVAEAIDFLDYYADQSEAMLAPAGADVPGEQNRFTYLPRGVVAVIAPWNFPLAILTGMTAAALATGNTVVMKPAGQSSVIGAKLMEVLQSAGIPAGVANYLPGRGGTMGTRLVEHPQVALIAFTGSRQVGLDINRRAAEVSASGNTNMVKRVIAEMGGKNAVIVDDDADPDEAVAGIVASAFGYAGQKCSACSRVIVLDAIHDALLERLVAAAKSLPVGPACDPATAVPAVIDDKARNKILEYIDIGRQEGTEVLSVDVGPLAAEGCFVGPHIFADISPDARLAQEEIFGPVLAVIRVNDLEEAIRVANGTDYALTAGIFSRSPANLERARHEINVGNLYLNRGCTGALVGRQPFGGFKMSGIGSKAGGADYLQQFVVPKTITENTLRRGFAPPE